MAKWKKLEECYKISDEDYFKARKICTVIIKDVSTEKMNQTYECLEEVREEYQNLFDETSRKLKTLQL